MSLFATFFITAWYIFSALVAPKNVKNISATSAENMYQAVMKNVANKDIFVGVAAVADYSPTAPSTQKIKKSTASRTLELTPNKDILADVAILPNAPFCVGFAAESENLLEYAEAKRKAKKLPLLVANLVQESMGQDEASITLLDDNGSHPLQKATKHVLAVALLKHMSQLLRH